MIGLERRTIHIKILVENRENDARFKGKALQIRWEKSREINIHYPIIKYIYTQLELIRFCRGREREREIMQVLSPRYFSYLLLVLILTLLNFINQGLYIENHIDGAFNKHVKWHATIGASHRHLTNSK